MPTTPRAASREASSPAARKTGLRLRQRRRGQADHHRHRLRQWRRGQPQLHLRRRRQLRYPLSVERALPAVRQHPAIEQLRRQRQPDQADRPRRQRHLHRLRRQGPRNRTRHLPEQLPELPRARRWPTRRRVSHQVARHVQPAHADRRAQQDHGQHLQRQRPAHRPKLDDHDRRHGRGQVQRDEDRQHVCHGVELQREQSGDDGDREGRCGGDWPLDRHLQD